MADTATVLNGSNSSNNNNDNDNVNSNGNGSIRPKMQIRTNGINSNSFNDKSPSPAAKLLISHGKPNFTIPRTNKSLQEQQDAANPLSPTLPANGNNNNYNAYKTANIYSNNNNSNNINNNSNNNKNILVGTKFNGVFKPTSVTLTAKPTTMADTENEAAKVVLRRARQPEPVLREDEDKNVPEFIRRQRRIQERLAKENVLDFENRRSGYFTHMMISPDSPNRTSFVETMSSPAIVPALEIPPPPVRIEEENEHELRAEKAAPVVVVTNGATTKEEQKEAKEPVKEAEQVPSAIVVAAATQMVNEVQQLAADKVHEQLSSANGHGSNGKDDVEADVAQAIEEVNKAVAGEDEPEILTAEVKTVAAEHTTTTATAVDEALAKVDAAVAKSLEVAVPPEVLVAAYVQVHAAANAAASADDAAAPTANGQDAELKVAQQNGHASNASNGHATDEITISHTNGSVGDNPSIPAPDPSGALGVNFEPKTVISFAQELGSGENKYPDTVKVVKNGELVEKPADSDNLQAMTKLKFDITGEQNDVQVLPVLKTD